jgi:hypothetical protein
LQVLPRSTTAIVIVLSAGSLAAVLTSSWILDDAAPPPLAARAHHPAEPPPGETPAAVAPAPEEPVVTEPDPEPSSAPASGPTQQPSALPAGDACSCERPDSVLWRLPLPRLSTLMIEQRARSHKDHQHIEMELAIVNNGREPLKEISLGVDFFEGEDKEPTKRRPLYYESWLQPGAAIKWHVEARGTSFVVTNPRKELLASEEVAGADAFAELLGANHRPVRLHAAMMLAYLGDPRAKEGAAKLRGALREEEASYLDRVLAAAEPSIACEIRGQTTHDGHTVKLCAHNRGSQERSGLSMRVRGLDREFDFRNPVAAPPIVVTEKRFDLPGNWPPGQGRWVSANLPNEGREVKSYEVFIGE